MKQITYRSFTEAKKFVQKIGIKSQTQWRKYDKTKIPKDIPNDVAKFYKKQGTWKGWGDFLGTGFVANQNRVHRPFTKARNYVHTLQLENRREWIEYCKTGKKPKDIPAAAGNVYKKEWKGWPDFLGYDSTGKRKFRSFVDAKKFVQKIGIKSQTQWRKYDKTKIPKDIPNDLSRVYKKEWNGWGDFLGTGTLSPIQIANKKPPFNEARKYARSLKFTNLADWTKHCKSGKKPNNIPAAADKLYRKEWKGWGDFLGTGTVANQKRQYLPIKEAKIEARKWRKKLDIKNEEEWKEACRAGKIPDNLPADLWNQYGKKKKR